MFKNIKIGLLLFSLFQLHSVCATAQISNTQDTIFVWDIHNVIMNPGSKLRAIKKYPNKKKALRQTKLRHKFVTCLIKSRFKKISSEELFALGKRYNNPYFTQMILCADSAQKPMDETISIIQELAQNGYRHHIASNIGPSTFQAITDAEQYPQFQYIFQHFDLKKSQVVDNPKLLKPNPQFFKQYLEKNNIDLNKTRVIFIDDKIKNIRSARSVGLEGIHFKSANQLRKELVKMGISISAEV